MAEWASDQAQVLQWRVPPSGDTNGRDGNATARRIVFVVTDAASQRPLQAVALGC